MGKLIFVLGGARSGKSHFAMQYAYKQGQNIGYIATAQAIDIEMETRIAQHKKDRPSNWKTIEIPRQIVHSLERQNLECDVLILDCLTLLVNNIMFAECSDENNPDEFRITAAINNEITSLLLCISQSRCTWIIVSNEVGLGLIPPNPLGRLYRDLLGKINQQFAQAADETYYLVAGIPLSLQQLSNFRFK